MHHMHTQTHLLVSIKPESKDLKLLHLSGQQIMLRDYYVPETVLGAGGTAAKEIDRVLPAAL